MIARVALVAFVALLALGTTFAMRKRSPLHLFTLFVLASGLVGSFYPAVTLWVEPSTWRNLSSLTEDTVLAVQLEYVALLTGLSLACLVQALRRRLEPPETVRVRNPALVRYRDVVVSCGLFLLGALLYAGYVERIGTSALFNRQDYAEKYLLGSGLGLFAAGIKVMIAACLWAEAGAVPRAFRWGFRVAGALLAIWSIGFLSVRTNFVLILLGYAYLAVRARGFELRRVRPALVVVLALSYVGLESFALFRGAYRGDLGSAVASLGANAEASLSRAVGGSELGHPFITAMEVVQTRDPGELRGESWLQSVPILLPLALYPNRPPTLSQQFVWERYPAMARLGGGTAFSLVGEAWLNLGTFIGSMTIGLALGLLLLHIEWRAARSPDGFSARIAPSLLLLIAIGNRSEMATLVKQSFILAAPALALWIGADAVWLGFDRSRIAGTRPRPALPREFT